MSHQPGSEYTFEEAQENARRWESQTFDFVVRVVRGCRATQTPEIFNAVSKADREAIWNILWNDKPLEVSQAMFVEAGDVVDWDGLFKGEGNENILQLRGVLKRHFVRSCKAVCSKCPNIDKISAEDREAWGQFWRVLPKDPDIAGIWTMERVPLMPEDRELINWLMEQKRLRDLQI